MCPIPPRPPQFQESSSSSPPGWENIRLDAVSEVRTGIAVGKDTSANRGLEVPYLRVANVQDGRLDLSEIKTIMVSSEEQARYSLQPDDVLLTEGGDFDKLGRGCLWTGEIHPCLHQNHVFAVRSSGGRLLPKFLSFYAASSIGKAYFLGCAKQTTNLASINSAQLRALPLLLPPLPEQRKIAAILSSVDEAIEGTQAVIDQLQVVKKAMMADLLTRGIPGRHKKFKQTEIGEVPAEWEVCSIDSLGVETESTVRSGPFGSSMKTKDFVRAGVPVLTIQSLGHGELLREGLFYVGDEKARELAEYKVRRNDVVFSRVADIGRCAAISDNEAGWLISPNLSRIRLDPRKADARFLMYLITTATSVLRQVEMVAGNAGRPVISSSTLRELRLPVPPLQEQQTISAVGQELEQRLGVERQFLSQLQGTKSALMSVLLTGEIRVCPDGETA
jgi:type I restriction enzyme S subunit